MISRQLNVNKCLTKVALYDAKLEKIKVINNADRLVSQLTKSANQGQAALLRDHLRTKIDNTPRASRGLLKKYLSIIAAVLNDEVESKRLSDSVKITVMDKLTEGLHNCSAGYLDRVYQIMGSLNQYESIDALLCAYRLQLVERAYYSTNSDEVHLHHRFHVVANASGLGIPYQDVKDPYTGAMSDASITQSLESVFQTYYTPKAIMQHFWEQAPIYQLGYVGPKEEGLGYDAGDYEALLSYFRKLFNNPELSHAACFKINKETGAVTDIHWASINTLLFNYFVSNGYFNLPDKKKIITAAKDHRTVRLEYSKDGIENAILRYKGLGKTRFVGYIDPENKSLIDAMNQDVLREFQGKVEAVFADAPLSRVKYLYQAGLVSLGFACPRLAAGIKGSDDFVAVAAGLSMEAVTSLLEAVKGQIVFKFESVQTLSRFIQRLSDQQLAFLMQQSTFTLALKALASSFKSKENFIVLFKALPDEKTSILFDELALGLLIQTSIQNDMVAIINVLPEEKVSPFLTLDMLRPKPIAPQANDYAYILSHVSESKRAAVADFTLNNFKHFEGTGVYALAAILAALPVDVARQLIQQQIDPLPNSMIKSAQDFLALMKQLSRNKNKASYNEFREWVMPQLPALVVDTLSFRLLMHDLSMKERKAFYSEVDDRLLPMIDSIKSASNVFDFLPEKERGSLFEIILPVLENSELTYFTGDFISFVNKLSLNQCEKLFSLPFISLQAKHDYWSVDALSSIVGSVLIDEKSALLLLRLKEAGIHELQSLSNIQKIVRNSGSRFRKKVIKAILPDSDMAQCDLLAWEFIRRVRYAYGSDYQGYSARDIGFCRDFISGRVSTDELITVMALSVDNGSDKGFLKIWHSVLKGEDPAPHLVDSVPPVVEEFVDDAPSVLPPPVYAPVYGYADMNDSFIPAYTGTLFSPVVSQAAPTHSHQYSHSHGTRRHGHGRRR